jgi:hypothetical protein
MFDEMGGEYDRFRIENLLKRKPLSELLKERKISIRTKLVGKDF